MRSNAGSPPLLVQNVRPALADFFEHEITLPQAGELGVEHLADAVFLRRSSLGGKLPFVGQLKFQKCCSIAYFLTVHSAGV